DELSLMANFALDMGLSLERLQVFGDELRRLDPHQRLGGLLEMAIAAEILPSDIDPSHIERLYNVFKTNVRAMFNYMPGPLDGRITLFQAEETRKVWGDSRGSWEGFALQGVELIETPGGHFTMVSAPHVKSLAESLARRI